MSSTLSESTPATPPHSTHEKSQKIPSSHPPNPLNITDEILSHISKVPFIEQFQTLMGETHEVMDSHDALQHTTVFNAESMLDLFPQISEYDNTALSKSTIADLQMKYGNVPETLPLQERLREMDDNDLVAQRWFEMARDDDTIEPEKLRDAMDLPRVHDIVEAMFGETRVLDEEERQQEMKTTIKEAFGVDTHEEDITEVAQTTAAETTITTAKETTISTAEEAPTPSHDENTNDDEEMPDSNTIHTIEEPMFSTTYPETILQKQDLKYQREQPKAHTMHEKDNDMERKMRALASMVREHGGEEGPVFDEDDLEEALMEVERMAPLDAKRDLLVWFDE